MHCYAAKERSPGEKRAALTPITGDTLVKLGLEVTAENGLGSSSDYADEAYEKAGVKMTGDHAGTLASADLVLGVRKPTAEMISGMKSGAVLMSHLDPFNEPELVKQLAAAGISAVSLEMIPRTTLAQKMDVLSSQMNLAGYSAVIQAAARSEKVAAHDDDPGRHHLPRPGLRDRRGRGRPAGHRHRQAPRRPGRGF